MLLQLRRGHRQLNAGLRPGKARIAVKHLCFLIFRVCTTFLRFISRHVASLPILFAICLFCFAILMYFASQNGTFGKPIFDEISLLSRKMRLCKKSCSRLDGSTTLQVSHN